MALSPDGATLASGSWSALELWDIAQGRENATLVGHTGGISSLAFSSDGTTLASGSYDRTARVWATATGGNKATFDLPTSVEAMRGTSQLAWDRSVAPWAAAVRNCFSREVNFLPSLISKALAIFCIR